MALRDQYKTILTDHFPQRIRFDLEIGNREQTLVWEKVTWTIDGTEQGLRYGENPDQEAALYRLVNGNLVLGDVAMELPSEPLASHPELLQSGKHPGKINITDADAALNILRYFTDEPAAVIVKHNNPSGVAIGETLHGAYYRALMADRVAAFGGTIALNQEVDEETAAAVTDYYAEVVVAPGYTDAALEHFAKKKNLRVLRIRAMENLRTYVGKRFLDFKSLIDGGLVVQWSFDPVQLEPATLVAASTVYKGQEYRIERAPTPSEQRDMRFGWLVESGVTSNSVIYVKDQTTVAIGTGEQDRVGVAEIARDKAYRKLADRLAFERYGTGYSMLQSETDRTGVDAEVKERRGGLPGSVMVSDAFFPFRDGVDVGLNQGVSAVLQPGGAIRDYEIIQACNAAGATMVFTGQRSFRH